MQQQAVAVAAGQPDSARVFVQRFYDWYLANDSDAANYDSLLAGRRDMLGDSLFRAFHSDVAAQHADTIAEINSLSAESDIFLNSQDPCEHYTTQGVTSAGPGAFAVTVAGDCGQDRRPNIEVYVRQRGSSWQIENVKDPTNPSYDLLSALVRYHATGPALPDTASADWLTYQGDGFAIRYPKEASLTRAKSHPSGMPGMAIIGPTIHVEVPPNQGPSDGPAYELILSSFPNPRGWSAEQWVDSLRRESNSHVDADSLGLLGAPDTVAMGRAKALRLRPFCGDCDPEELYFATPRRMIVASYVFDISIPGDRKAQARLYRAVVSTLRPGD